VSGCYPLDPYYKALPEAETLKAIKSAQGEKLARLLRTNQFLAAAFEVNHVRIAALAAALHFNLLPPGLAAVRVLLHWVAGRFGFVRGSAFVFRLLGVLCCHRANSLGDPQQETSARVHTREPS